MGVMNRFLNYLGLQEEQEQQEAERERFAAENEEQEIETPAFETRRHSSKNNVVSIHSQKAARVVLTEPRSYDEAQEIADHLKSRRSVVVNLQRVRRDQAIRIVDFLSGTVYALGGHISKLGSDIFLCTPDSVEVSGTITEMLSEESVDYPKMR
ncbi:cell division protein SepF [Cohnella sp. CIP 111063]|uniref:cell division protein SepF n=1 Tax=unclassified Cohnella TaxID=2636738 RepID=UPI000B8C21CF|nr:MULTISPECIES: cell division protein SepF [unclassified Cohnella]OXS62427.1 cell division protein SepF [Cohnella sp. CIP 111063]PRX74665.1 cell division inhibitor SepF [Cohnella sp. SGD-V74]